MKKDRAGLLTQYKARELRAVMCKYGRGDLLMLSHYDLRMLLEAEGDDQTEDIQSAEASESSKQSFSGVRVRARTIR